MPRIGLDLPALIHEAAEIADTQGLESVTIASIAQKLQIRSPSIYNHVKGLPELRRQLALSGLKMMSDQFHHALVGKSGDDAVRSLSYAYLSYAREHPGLYEAAQRAAEPDDLQLQEAGGEVVQIVVNSLEGYGLGGDEVIHAVRGMRSMLHGFASLERLGGFGLPLDLDITFSLLIRTFLEGLKAMQTADRE